MALPSPPIPGSSRGYGTLDYSPTLSSRITRIESEVTFWNPNRLSEYILQNIADPTAHTIAQFIEALGVSGREFMNLPQEALETMANSKPEVITALLDIQGKNPSISHRQPTVQQARTTIMCNELPIPGASAQSDSHRIIPESFSAGSHEENPINETDTPLPVDQVENEVPAQTTNTNSHTKTYDLPASISEDATNISVHADPSNTPIMDLDNLVPVLVSSPSNQSSPETLVNTRPLVITQDSQIDNTAPHKSSAIIPNPLVSMPLPDGQPRDTQTSPALQSDHTTPPFSPETGQNEMSTNGDTISSSSAQENTLSISSWDVLPNNDRSTKPSPVVGDGISSQVIPAAHRNGKHVEPNSPDVGGETISPPQRLSSFPASLVSLQFGAPADKDSPTPFVTPISVIDVPPTSTGSSSKTPPTTQDDNSSSVVNKPPSAGSPPDDPLLPDQEVNEPLNQSIPSDQINDTEIPILPADDATPPVTDCHPVNEDIPSSSDQTPSDKSTHVLEEGIDTSLSAKAEIPSPIFPVFQQPANELATPFIPLNLPIIPILDFGSHLQDKNTPTPPAISHEHWPELTRSNDLDAVQSATPPTQTDDNSCDILVLQNDLKPVKQSPQPPGDVGQSTLPETVLSPASSTLSVDALSVVMPGSHDDDDDEGEQDPPKGGLLFSRFTIPRLALFPGVGTGGALTPESLDALNLPIPGSFEQGDPKGVVDGGSLVTSSPWAPGHQLLFSTDSTSLHPTAIDDHAASSGEEDLEFTDDELSPATLRTEISSIPSSFGDDDSEFPSPRIDIDGDEHLNLLTDGPDPSVPAESPGRAEAHDPSTSSVKNDPAALIDNEEDTSPGLPLPDPSVVEISYDPPQPHLSPGPFCAPAAGSQQDKGALAEVGTFSLPFLAAAGDGKYYPNTSAFEQSNTSRSHPHMPPNIETDDARPRVMAKNGANQHEAEQPSDPAPSQEHSDDSRISFRHEMSDSTPPVIPALALPSLTLGEQLSLLSPLFSPGAEYRGLSTLGTSPPLDDQIHLPSTKMHRTLWPIESHRGTGHLRSFSSPIQAGKRIPIHPADQQPKGTPNSGFADTAALPKEQEGMLVDAGVQTDEESPTDLETALRQRIRHLEGELQKAQLANLGRVKDRPTSFWSKLFASENPPDKPSPLQAPNQKEEDEDFLIPEIDGSVENSTERWSAKHVPQLLSDGTDRNVIIS